jgi:hypothetical protein
MEVDERYEINIFQVFRTEKPRIFFIPFEEHEDRRSKLRRFIEEFVSTCENLIWYKLEDNVRIIESYKPGIYFTCLSSADNFEVQGVDRLTIDTTFIETKLLNKALKQYLQNRILEDDRGEGIGIDAEEAFDEYKIELPKNDIIDEMNLRVFHGAYIWHQTLGDYENDTLKRLEIGVSIYPFYSVEINRRISTLLSVMKKKSIPVEDLNGVIVKCNNNERTLYNRYIVKNIDINSKELEVESLNGIRDMGNLKFGIEECVILPNYKRSLTLLNKIEEYKHALELVKRKSREITNSRAMELSLKIRRWLNEEFYTKIELGGARYSLV